MYYFLLTHLILDGLLLAAVVLLQAGQGGGLASMGGGTTDLVVGGRQAATLLTKLSWICGGIPAPARRSRGAGTAASWKRFPPRALWCAAATCRRANAALSRTRNTSCGSPAKRCTTAATTSGASSTP